MTRSAVLILLTACATRLPSPTPSGGDTSARESPCSTEAHRAFDFWIGEWDVSDASGDHAGTNAITSAEYGCLIVEEWTSVSGLTGQSYNFLDPGTGQWRQVWVSGGAVIDYSGGLTPAGSMRLEGTIAYQGSSGTSPFIGEWTPNADGTVTQHFWQFDAETDTWVDWFVGTYTRRSSIGGP